MQKVGSREFKNRLGKYLASVRGGKTLLITDRGKAVAKVVPPDHGASPTLSFEDILKRLDAEGKIRLARRPLGKMKPVASRGKSAAQMIIEDRR